MNNYISHHGILGQKWGVRRYQNKDGTLTEAGKKKLRAEVKEAYNNSTNQKQFGKNLTNSELVKKYINSNKTRKEIQKNNSVYDRHIDVMNFKANLTAQKAVGGKDFVSILGNPELTARYFETGKKVADKYFATHKDTMLKSLDNAIEAGKRYERETRDFVNSFMGDEGKAKSSYADALSVNVKNGKVSKQSLSDMTVNALLSESGAIEAEIARKKYQ